MENKKISLEEISFQIISYSGEAKSYAMEAIKIMREERNITKTHEKLAKAEKMIIEAEKQHMDLIVDEANGIIRTPTILFLHAEDQLLSTQTLIAMVHEMVLLYQKIDERILK